VNAAVLHLGSALFFGAIAAVALSSIVSHCIAAAGTKYGRLLRLKWKARQ
jgi:hypothetical protein